MVAGDDPARLIGKRARGATDMHGAPVAHEAERPLRQVTGAIAEDNAGAMPEYDPGLAFAHDDATPDARQCVLHSGPPPVRQPPTLRSSRSTLMFSANLRRDWQDSHAI